MKEPEFTHLSYVLVELNEHQILALVDSGVTHNFVNKEVTKRLRLKIEQKENTLKAANSGVERVVGLAHQVSLSIGEWTGMGDFMIVPLDDFKVVLR